MTISRARVKQAKGKSKKQKRPARVLEFELALDLGGRAFVERGVALLSSVFESLLFARLLVLRPEDAPAIGVLCVLHTDRHTCIPA